jgi:hypothetical protein
MLRRDRSRLRNEFVNLTHDVFRRHQLKVVRVLGHSNQVLREFSSENTFVKGYRVSVELALPASLDRWRTLSAARALAHAPRGTILQTPRILGSR